MTRLISLKPLKTSHFLIKILVFNKLRAVLLYPVHHWPGYLGLALPLLEAVVALTERLLNILKQVLHAVQDQAASLTRSSHSCHLKIPCQQ